MGHNGRTTINEVEAIAAKNWIVANGLRMGKEEKLRTVDILQGIIVNLHDTMVDLQRETNDAKLMLAAIAYQEGGSYQIDNAAMVATPREISFEKNPPGKDGIVIRVNRKGAIQ